MEIAAEIRAAADSMELLVKLFAEMDNDMHPGTVFTVKSSKRRNPVYRESGMG